jgi:predicted ABC-type transport system involved in lysophospholipase L1 biosynthesis ATPase subunit
MVTHDPRYVGRAGRNVFLFDGRVVPHMPVELEVA